tara:strand:- start:240 stop:593 length:354 start_codon:yes stop_codon:yes gene_type:complete
MNTYKYIEMKQNKTFLFDLICDDLNEKIIDIVETKRNKEKYNSIVLHLNQYADEFIDDEESDDDEDFQDFKFVCYNNFIRIDCRFLEYNNLWNTKSGEIIINKYGKEIIDDFMDNEF